MPLVPSAMDKLGDGEDGSLQPSQPTHGITTKDRSDARILKNANLYWPMGNSLNLDTVHLVFS